MGLKPARMIKFQLWHRVTLSWNAVPRAVNEFEASVATKFQKCSRLPFGGGRVQAKDLYQSGVYL